MREHLADALLKTADVLHWLGRYTECNALILTSRLLRVHDLDDLDKLRAFVEREEEAAS
jgi:hypothetical protein